MHVVFKELPPFDRDRDRYISDEELRRLQLMLDEYPRAGNVIPGSGGMRKIRIPDPKRQKGKRGGLRIIYYFWEEHHMILLCMIYSKGDVEGLSREELGALRRVLNNYIAV